MKFISIFLVAFVIVSSSLIECRSNKLRIDNESSSSQELDDYPELCLIQPYRGPCEAYILRYYFDANEETCKKFVYGGCRGNSNNFVTYAECMRICKK